MEHYNSFRQVLFGKVDLDTITTALVLGITSQDQNLRCVVGSASAEELRNPAVLCVETGGTGRTAENNFDHHPQGGEQKIDLSACAQALERLSRLVRYVDEVDRGLRTDGVAIRGHRFPSLVQLISGMKLVVKDPEEQLRWGLEVMRVVLQSGLDPYGCMEKIADWIPEAATWISAKREHDRHFAEVCQAAKWLTTEQGIKIAAVETTWFGAPGALQGEGADIVIALDPEHRDGNAGTPYRKFTVAAHRGAGISLIPATEKLNELENGWGGPTHGTICGSPKGQNSTLSIEEVLQIVNESLADQKIVYLGSREKVA